MGLRYKQWDKKLYIRMVKFRSLIKGTNEWNQGIRVQTNEIKIQTMKKKISYMYGEISTIK